MICYGRDDCTTSASATFLIGGLFRAMNAIAKSIGRFKGIRYLL
jgi:hypothetical protein